MIRATWRAAAAPACAARRGGGGVVAAASADVARGRSTAGGVARFHAGSSGPRTKLYAGQGPVSVICAPACATCRGRIRCGRLKPRAPAAGHQECRVEQRRRRRTPRRPASLSRRSPPAARRRRRPPRPRRAGPRAIVARLFPRREKGRAGRRLSGGLRRRARRCRVIRTPHSSQPAIRRTAPQPRRRRRASPRPRAAGWRTS